ncbi:GNAT family N-acetyltransferase [Litchfieldia alkalitelluris]|uniref:GNAT family N-acetyltransferase n=1 Tax=Litchfieldia alkalitelluris TaxID=304268 RepID=UPI000995F920|nr:GNAT family N-acetyltransferase [Litchfieldia alkalitelluris]
MEWNKGQFLISDDKDKIQIELVLRLLLGSYWAKDLEREVIEKAIQNSVCFGIYCDNKQIGFARAITDRAVMTWILDVIVDEQFRGNGLGKWLVECMLNHPELKDTKFRLTTSDAHELYRKFGFDQEKIMVRQRV